MFAAPELPRSLRCACMKWPRFTPCSIVRKLANISFRSIICPMFTSYFTNCSFPFQLCSTTPCMICGSEEIKQVIEDHLGIKVHYFWEFQHILNHLFIVSYSVCRKGKPQKMASSRFEKLSAWEPAPTHS